MNLRVTANSVMFFFDKWFPGRVKMPITRVLGGARFDGIFEAFV